MIPSAIRKLWVHESPRAEFKTLESCRFNTYRRDLIQYLGDELDEVRAYLFVPNAEGKHPAVLVHHQHNGERHFGKSEVAGLVGDPVQAFGPALADRGFVVLAPDSIGFEDRRANMKGTKPDPELNADFVQHLNQMAYRMLRGDTLMRKILSDAALAVSILFSLPEVRTDRVGVLGHSYGGNTSLFHAALDDRIAFAAVSGALCSYKRKINDGTGIELSMILPGVFPEFDVDDLLVQIAPRPTLIVSSADDKYSADAADVIRCGVQKQPSLASTLHHFEYPGGHSLNKERLRGILDWVSRIGLD